MGIYHDHYGLAVIYVFALLVCKDQAVKSRLEQCHGKNQDSCSSENAREQAPNKVYLRLPRLEAVKTGRDGV